MSGGTVSVNLIVREKRVITLLTDVIQRLTSVTDSFIAVSTNCIINAY